MNRQLTAVMSLSAAALFAPCLAAADVSPAPPPRQATAFQRLTDLTPERIAAFRRTMQEMGSYEPSKLNLAFQAQYDAPDFRLERQAAPRLFAEDDTLIVPPGVAGRDAWADEEFLIAHREDDFEDAAEKWVTRQVKGSDGAAARRGHRMAPKFGWDGGPLAGFRQGPISVMGGEDQWNVRWTRKMSRPGWVTRVSCGVEDGEERVAFSIGRSLFHATTSKR